MKYTYNTSTALEKVAAVSDAAKLLPEAAASLEKAPKLLERLKTFFSKPETRLGLVQMLAPMAGFVVADFIEDVVSSVKKYRATSMEPVFYRKMLNTHPELMNADPEMVGKLWASLWHHAPLMAQDPVAAGAFIRQTIQRGHMQEFGGPAPDTYSTLTSINQNLAGGKGGDKGTGAKGVLGTHFTKYLLSGYGSSQGSPAMNSLLGADFNKKDSPGFAALGQLAQKRVEVEHGYDL